MITKEKESKSGENPKNKDEIKTPSKNESESNDDNKIHKRLFIIRKIKRNKRKKKEKINPHKEKTILDEEKELTLMNLSGPILEQTIYEEDEDNDEILHLNRIRTISCNHCNYHNRIIIWDENFNEEDAMAMTTMTARENRDFYSDYDSIMNEKTEICTRN